MSGVFASKFQQADVKSSNPRSWDVHEKQASLDSLKAIAQRILTAKFIDDIIVDVAEDICELFQAQRMTIYTVSANGRSIVSKIKTGLKGYADILLPISESSLAGACAIYRQPMKFDDVYDDDELQTFSPNLAFLKSVDQRTGFRSRQMLSAPILRGDRASELAGVLQIINTRSGQPFTLDHVELAVELARTLADCRWRPQVVDDKRQFIS